MGNEGDNEDFFRKAKEIEKRLTKITLVKPPLPPKKGYAQSIKVIEQAEKSLSPEISVKSWLIGYSLKTVVSRFTVVSA